MKLVKLGLFGALGAMAWKFWKNTRQSPAAFAEGQGQPENFAQVRDAGPEAMRDGARRPWTKEDQASDESFPASDPPANY